MLSAPPTASQNNDVSLPSHSEVNSNKPGESKNNVYCVGLVYTDAYYVFICACFCLGDARALKDVGRVMVLYRRTIMPYAAYSRKHKGPTDETAVEQYAGLVGQDCAERILLYRS